MHILKHWSRTPSLIALSSGESELHATLHTAAETLGLMAMARDLGICLQGKAWGDASAASGITHRNGLGRTRHIDVRHLWVQQVVAERRLEFGKTLGRDNPADLFVKYLDQRTMDKHVERLMGRYVNGRPPSAPELRNICLSWAKCAEGCREIRTSWRSAVEAELQDWITTLSVEVVKRAINSKEVERIDIHVQGKFGKPANGGTQREWGQPNNATPCEEFGNPISCTLPV